MEAILRRLASMGLRRGLKGSRAWLALGIAVAGARMLRRLARPRPEVVYRTTLQPGEGLEIRGLPAE